MLCLPGARTPSCSSSESSGDRPGRGTSQTRPRRPYWGVTYYDYHYYCCILCVYYCYYYYY